MVIFFKVTHVAIGLTVGLLFYDWLGSLGLFMTSVGSLIPDMGYGRLSLIFSRKWQLVAPIEQTNSLGVVGSGKEVKYRGWLHSFLGLIVFSIPIMLYNLDLAHGIFIGYITHLLADTLTPEGIPFFYPFVKKDFHFIGIKVDAVKEATFIIIFLAVIHVLILRLK